MRFLSNEKNLLRVSLFIGIFFCLIHFILAWLFYKERMAHGDSCFYVFKLIHFQAILCENHRYSVFLFQWIPWLALKAGASIDLLLKIYSGTFIIYFLTVLLITSLILKSWKGAFAMLFFMFISLRRDFYMPVAEYQAGFFTSLALCSIFFTDTFSSYRKALFFALVIIAISLNFHYVSLLGIIYILVFDSLYYREFKFKKIILPVLIFITPIILLKQVLVPLSGYEQAKMPATAGVIYYFLHPAALPKLKLTFDYFFSVMPASVMIALAALTFNLFKKKWLSFLFDLLFIYAAAILLSVIHGPGDNQKWFEEYMLLFFFPASVSLAYHLTDMKKYKVLLPATLVLCGILSVNGILSNYNYFHEKIKYAERLIERGRVEKEKKYIIYAGNVPGLYINNTWGIPFGTLLLSSLESPDSALTIFATNEPGKYDDLIKDPAFFLGPEWDVGAFNHPGWYLRKEYFNLPERGYLKLNSPQVFTSQDNAYLNSDNIVISPARHRYFSTPDSFLVVEVKIENMSGKKISSLFRPDTTTCLSYHLYNDRGDSLITFDNWRTALETDIDSVSWNGINIRTKNLPAGRYTVEVDLLTEYVRWWGINSRFKLIVK